MMEHKHVIIRSILSEKANLLAEKRSCYVFRVDKSANKIQIKRAVEELYGVEVASVNTLVSAAKKRRRMTKTGVLQGRKPSYKRAIVRLAEGNSIDVYAGEGA